MTTEEIVTAWRKWGKQGSDMVRIRKSVLKNINLPEETKLFLNQGGLVDTVYGGTLVPTLPRLTDLVAKAKSLPAAFQRYQLTEPLPASYARYRVIGDLGYKDFQCLDEEGDGQVVVVKIKVNPARVLFLNSSIQQYAECCLAWSATWRATEQEGIFVASKEWGEYMAKYERAIREIDPRALANKKNWLARKLKNYKAGLL